MPSPGRLKCIDAIEKDSEYIFPYKIRKGYSFQCIAIELLGREKFPKELIENAIKMKNKISKISNHRKKY